MTSLNRIFMPVVRLASVNYLAYKNALKQAWKDGKMSADESAMLDTLRKSLNISAEDHMHIEREVRNELAGIIPENPNFVNVNNNTNGGTSAVDPGSINQHEYSNMSQLSTEELLESNDVKELLNAGKNAYHKQNYEDAIQFCDKVLLLDPDNSEALFFRKRTLSKLEKSKSKKGSGEVTAKVTAPPAPINKSATVEEAAQMEADLDEAAELNLEPMKENPSKNSVNNNVAPGAEKKADPNCKTCGGSGECHWCQGTGKCYWCKGTGNCDKCKGEGQIKGEECKSCKGSGKCHSCNGDSNCYWCKGTGKCSKCSL